MRLLMLTALMAASCPFGASLARRPLPIEVAHPIATYPHDTASFTEGLFYRDGALYEAGGLGGRSTISRIDPATGRSIASVALPPRLFGEGIVDWGDQIYSVTWHGGLGFRWSIDGLTPLGELHYKGEGWGLTRTDRQLILSDGTARLRFLDPADFHVVRTLRVTAAGRPVRMLNELEYVRGEILANIWHANRIARIDPADGHVKGWIDLTPIVKSMTLHDPEAVANGIAYDSDGDRLFVTGKFWPLIFELRPPATGG